MGRPVSAALWRRWRGSRHRRFLPWCAHLTVHASDGTVPKQCGRSPASRGREVNARQPVRMATTSAKASRAVRTGSVGQHLEQRLGLGREADHVGARLGHRRVRAQQGERLGVRGVLGEVRGQQLEQPGVGRIGGTLRDQHRQRGHALAEVGAGRLAGLLGLRGDVEDVVGELEGDADLLAVLRERLDDVSRRPGEHRAVAGGGRDQRAGLAGDDAQVVLERVVVRRRAEGLQDLALDEPGERLRLDAHGLRPEVGGQLARTSRTGSRR